MDEDQSNVIPRSTGRFTVLTNPVRAFAERAASRAWPGRRGSRNVPPSAGAHAASAEPAPATRPLEETGPQPFVTSEVISAFHLQQLRVPTSFERVTQGAARGGKVAIGTSIVLLLSLLGFGYWDETAVVSQGREDAARLTQILPSPSALPAAVAPSSVAPRASEAASPLSTGHTAAERDMTEPSATELQPRSATAGHPLAVRPAEEARGGSGVRHKPAAHSAPKRASSTLPPTIESPSETLPGSAVPAVVETSSPAPTVAPKASAESALPVVPRVYRLP